MLALFIVGPGLVALTGELSSPIGLTHPTPMLAGSLIKGMSVLGLWFAAAGLLGGLAAKASTVRTGFITAGLVLCWPAWHTSQSHELIREASGLAPIGRLLIEGVLAGLFTLILAFVLNRVSSPEYATDRMESKNLLSQLARLETAKVIAAGIAAGAVGAWFVAVSPMKGQAIAAACFGGLAAGAAARLASPESRPFMLAMPIALLAFAGPLAVLIMHRTTALAAADAGRLFPLANILPIDMIAGGLIGLAWGEAWAHSMIAKNAPEIAPHAATSHG
jgi:hypothetical protein